MAAGKVGTMVEWMASQLLDDSALLSVVLLDGKWVELLDNIEVDMSAISTVHMKAAYSAD